jgi:hypothetical protein
VRAYKYTDTHKSLGGVVTEFGVAVIFANVEILDCHVRAVHSLQLP